MVANKATDPLRLAAYLDEPWKTMHSMSRGFSGKMLAETKFPGLELKQPSREEFHLRTQSVWSLRDESRGAFSGDNKPSTTLIPDYVYKGTWMAPKYDDSGVPNEPVKYPKTQLQKDIGYESEAPAAPEGKGFIMEESKFHPYYGFSKTKLVLVDKPKSLDRDGKGLITPGERRENLVFAVRNRKADKLIRKASSDANRLRTSLKMNYPNGVLGFDSHDNEKSEVYGQKAKRRTARKKKYFNDLRKRGESLKHKNDSVARRGYPLLEHSSSCGAIGSNKPFLQRKGRPVTAPKDGVVKLGKFWQKRGEGPRFYNLLNEDSGGRKYDILNNTKRFYTPTCPEKKRMKERHPSTQYTAYCHPDED